MQFELFSFNHGTYFKNQLYQESHFSTLGTLNTHESHIFKILLGYFKINSVAPMWIQFRGKRDGVPEVNKVSEFHSSINQQDKGKVYDKKPFKFTCEKGKSYMWCSCGYSKTQVKESKNKFNTFKYQNAMSF